jgi:hypothetical protein
MNQLADALESIGYEIEGILIERCPISSNPLDEGFGQSILADIKLQIVPVPESKS